MITVTDRRYNTVCQIHYDLPNGLIAYNDVFMQDLSTGISTYEFSVDKTDESIDRIRIGYYVLAQDGDTIRTFEIMTIEEDNFSKTIYCEDSGLDLLGEQVSPYKADKSYTIAQYVSKFTHDSGWEVGIDEIGNSSTRKLEWEGISSATKRLRELAGRFNAEITYTVEIVDNKVSRKLINIYRRVGEDKGVRLEYGYEVSSIRKKETIENLATALVPVGQDGLTLDGYQFTETDRYKLAGNMLFDKIEGERWKRKDATGGGYVVRFYESQAQSQKTLLDEAINQLKKCAYPEVSYEVEINTLPEAVNIGDSVVVIDNDYRPALTLKARVESIKRSFTDEHVGMITITNVVESFETLEEKVRRLSRVLQEKLFDWNAVPISMTLTSSKGAIFKDGVIDTVLNATLFKNGIDVTNQATKFVWQRTSDQKKSSDIEWDKRRETHTRHSLTVNANDVQLEKTFICTAYKDTEQLASASIILKDFNVGKFVQNTPPKTAKTGDLWLDTSVEPNVLQILKNGAWVPVVQDLTAITESIKSFEKEVDKVKKEVEKIDDLQLDYNVKMQEVIDTYTDIQTKLETKLSQDDLRDLSGQFSDLQKGYERLRESAEKIEGLGERVTAYEVNVQQSQLLINALSSYFSFSDDGMLIGKEGSPLSIRQTNDKLSFLDGGKEVAYISNQQMYITSGIFVENLILANHKAEKIGTEFTLISWVGGN